MPPVPHQEVGKTTLPPNHDELFHFVMRQPECAGAWLRSRLPVALANDVDWATLAPAHDRIPGVRLRAQHADLVFAATLHGGRRSAWFVVEHKSEARRGGRDQTLRYCVHLRRLAQRARTPAIVVPLLLHHGAQPLADDEPDAGDAFALFTPRLHVLVHDLAAGPRDDRDLPPLVRLLFACFAAVRLPPHGLLASIDGWRDLLRAIEASEGPPPPEDVFDAIGWYVVEHSDLTEQQVAAALARNLERPAGVNMTTGQRIRAESRALGRVEGRAELLLQLLAQRFTEVPAGVRERLHHASLADLERWTNRLLTAPSLAAVFAD